MPMSTDEINKIVTDAYAGIGRTGVGAAPSQIDQGGLDYWSKQLASGALNKDTFKGAFDSAVKNYLTEKPATDAVGSYVTGYQRGTSNTNDSLTNLQNQYNNLNNNFGNLQNQLAALQAKYDALLKNNTGNSGGTIIGGGVVNPGDGGGGGTGSTGPVWGPDGKMYSSVAAAIAAGVTNYTFSRPVSVQNSSGLISGADDLVNISNAATGNTNPGASGRGAAGQLFTLAPGVRLPGGIKNPFAA